MKILKNTKGITLIALVVTIIVLIILASVSINLLLGNNGIITKAKDAKQNYEIAANEENDNLKSLLAEMDENLKNKISTKLAAFDYFFVDTEGNAYEYYPDNECVNISKDDLNNLTPVAQNVKLFILPAEGWKYITNNGELHEVKSEDTIKAENVLFANNDTERYLTNDNKLYISDNVFIENVRKYGSYIYYTSKEWYISLDNKLYCFEVDTSNNSVETSYIIDNVEDFYPVMYNYELYLNRNGELFGRQTDNPNYMVWESIATNVTKVFPTLLSGDGGVYYISNNNLYDYTYNHGTPKELMLSNVKDCFNYSGDSCIYAITLNGDCFELNYDYVDLDPNPSWNSNIKAHNVKFADNAGNYVTTDNKLYNNSNEIISNLNVVEYASNDDGSGPICSCYKMSDGSYYIISYYAGGGG